MRVYPGGNVGYSSLHDISGRHRAQYVARLFGASSELL
jgi:hypothetical protein